MNVGSQAAAGAGGAVGPHYAATKAALHALTRSVAAELAADRIIVNGIIPGFTLTDLMRSLRTPEQLEEVRQSPPPGALRHDRRDGRRGVVPVLRAGQLLRRADVPHVRRVTAWRPE